MEIPVSAFNIAGIDQLISHQQTGLMANLHDEDQLLKDWECLLDDSAYATQLAQNARQFVEQHFSAQRKAAEYDCLFRELLEV